MAKPTITLEENNYSHWATEDTQLQLLAAVRSKGGGGGGGGSKENRDAAKGLKDLTGATKKAKDGLQDMVQNAGGFAGALLDTSGTLASMNPIVDAFADVLSKAIGGIAKFAPIVGDGLADLATLGIEFAAESVKFLAVELDAFAEGFRDAAQRGAMFSGSLEDFARMSTEAGFSVENLGAVLAENQYTMMAFGSSTKAAEMFLGNMAKLRKSHLYEDMLQMGYSVDQINTVAGDFYEMLIRTGRADMLRKGNEKELMAATAGYAKNLTVLAKLTGQDVTELQKSILAKMEEGYWQETLRKAQEKNGDAVVGHLQVLQQFITEADKQAGGAFSQMMSVLGVATGQYAPMEAVFSSMNFNGRNFRDAIFEYREALNKGQLTKEESEAWMNELMELYRGSVSSKEFRSLAEMGQIGDDFLGAISDMVGGLQAYDTAIDTAGDDVGNVQEDVIGPFTKNLNELNTYLTSNNETANKIIGLQNATLTRQLAFELKIAENINTASGIITASYEKLNEILMAMVDPEIKIKDVIMGWADEALEGTEGYFKERLAAIKDFVVEKLENLYVTTKNVVFESAKWVWKGLDKVGDKMLNPIDTLESWNVIGPETGDAYDAKKAEISEAVSEAVITGAKKSKREVLDMWNWMWGTNYAMGTPGVIDFGQGTPAMLHGKEAVIPAPGGSIPVDLGDTLKPLSDFMSTLTGGNNLLAQGGGNSVQSKEVVVRLEEMIGILKYIADTNKQEGVIRALQRLNINDRGTDLFRTA